jgi:hypothetical protein
MFPKSNLNSQNLSCKPLFPRLPGNEELPALPRSTAATTATTMAAAVAACPAALSED